ncbi:HAMP domain-containing protein [Paenibacillus sp. LMG 31461]|uniref:HAMP domain-containing protein n=1 Tax=Paenibacillus plantarum TaxID=2654975 RepID=A0ABX1XK24_9BACL|nr:histidine kinase [Paenibacillus plantarum]NOU68875.1 HAMP domain-containing protein [Paenibacillus plantarum]
MDGRRKTFQYSIFPKLIVAFLLVVAPLYFLGIVTNKQAESSVSKELSDSLASRVDFYSNTLKNEKSHILTLQRQYINDRDLRQLSFIGGILSSFEWADTVLNIQNKLQLIKSSSVYIENVSAHILTLGRTVSSNKPLSDRISDDYEAVRPVKERDSSHLIYWQHRLFLSLAFPDPPLPDKEPAYLLSIELSEDKLKHVLDQISNYSQSGAMMLEPKEGWSITGGEENEEVLPYLKSLFQRKYTQGILSGVESQTIGSRFYLVAYQFVPEFDSYLSIYVPEHQVFGILDKNRKLFWILSGISALIIVVYSYWTFRLIHRPLNVLVRSFRKIEEGQLDTITPPRGHDEFFYLFNHFNAMVRKLNILIHQVYEEKIRSQSSELKQLQSQINPHFLYNTYFILYRLAKVQDHDGVMQFSKYLGQYFQYITRNASDEVSLRDEVAHSRTYVEIQNIRFSNRINIDFDELPTDLELVPVPRLILQPILENAYKYGLEGKLEGGKISVHIESEHTCIRILVEDNGDELSQETLEHLQLQLAENRHDREFTGLLNVHRRLQLMYGETFGIQVARGKEGGLQVHMTLKSNREGGI